ncbi:unnamed protein product [Chilo suppressalis]|uniref:Fibronectin type-III domain-containing protein n=1 Tax=Chilo suppressalis TaxID=168631 RepID=A0ABN8BIG0_CHISP|nr:unnamed protein product [Chilo suppressalis]
MQWFGFVLLATVSQAAVLPTKSVNEQENDIPVPNLTSLIAEDPFAFKLGWEPVKSDAADPILGYKVKIWEQPKRKVYKYETVDGIKELVEEYAPAKFPMTSDAPDFEPKEVVIVKADKHEAKGKNMNQGVIYEFRVQAFTKNGDGPLSAPMRLQFQKPKNDDHKRDIGIGVTWEPVYSPSSNPVVGYKVKVWEQQTGIVYEYIMIDGVLQLVEREVLVPFFCVLLLVAVAKASVLKTAEDIPAPHLLRLVSLDPPGFKIEWNPVKSKDEADPVIGYKVKIWEQQSVKTYNYETVDGIPTLVQQSALNPVRVLAYSKNFEGQLSNGMRIKLE